MVEPTNAITHRHHFSLNSRLRNAIGDADVPTHEGPGHVRQHCRVLVLCDVVIFDDMEKMMASLSDTSD